MTPEHKALVAKLRGSVGRLTEEDCNASAAAIESLSAQSAQPQAGEAVARCCSAVSPCSWQRHHGMNAVCPTCTAAAPASPQPANPVQVTELIEDLEQAVIDFENARSDTYNRAKKELQRARAALTAAIGAVGQGGASAKPEPDFAASIAEVIKEESAGGAACGWESSSGCHETNEGAESVHYPYSKMFGCYVGSGCSECGGLGVVWEHWSDDALKMMAADISGSAHPAPSGQAAGAEAASNAQSDFDQILAESRGGIGNVLSALAAKSDERVVEATYPLGVIKAAVRIKEILDGGCDRGERDDFELLERYGLMDRGVCSDTFGQDTLEIGETMWTFNAAGEALCAALAASTEGASR